MSATDDDRPNILLITNDQQHHRLMSCAGDTYVKTPNLDRLAASGARFDLAYSPNPVCVPCRYSMMTGRMPHVFGGLEDNWKRDRSRRPKMRDHIDTRPMGWMMRDAGYETAVGGKLHVEGGYSFTKEDEPTYGFACLTSDIRDDLADECARFLRRPHEQPFLLWASFESPHDICGFLTRDGALREQDEPLDVPLPDNHGPTRDECEWMRGFRDGSLGEESRIELGLNRRYGRLAAAWDERTWRRYRGAYRSFMETADRQIGVVLDALYDAGLAERTVVIFTSDHGDHDGAHRLTMKRSFYEESAHVPLIVSAPGRVAPGVVDERHLVNVGPDLIPTLCDYAGVEAPASLPGRSVRALAEGRGEYDWREYVVSETVGGRMVRTARYKYMVYCLDRAEEQLFDMEADPGEMENLAPRSEKRDVLAAHRSTLRGWVDKHGDEKGRAYLDALQA